MPLHGTRSMYAKGCRCQPCKDAQNEYVRNWMKAKGKPIRDRHRAKRRAILDDIKNKPCAECGVWYPPYVMELDHLGDKEFNIGSGNRFSMTQLMEEIDKTEVVCANCHRVRTFNRAMYGTHPAPSGHLDLIGRFLESL